MIAGKLDRARVHMPPGHAKTETITWRLPTFIWKYVDKRARILITCHSQDYARDLGWAIREHAKEAGLELREDTRAKDAFRTLDGGYLRACGVGSTPTGRRFHYIIGDDPIKDRKQIESAITRKSMDQWWTQGIMSRLLPGGKVFLIFTRWHEDDLGGRLESREAVGGDKYEVLTLPAIAEDGDQIGRQPGEALWPAVYPIDELHRRRRNMIDEEGERGWQALFQQRPTPAEGDMFNVANLHYIDERDVPRGLKADRAWDVGASPSGDWTVGVGMAGPDSEGFFYVVDVVRVKLATDRRDLMIYSTAERDGRAAAVILPQDPGAAGLAQVTHWRRELAGFNVQIVRPDAKKEIRAGPVSSAVNAGKIKVVRASWNAAFVEELRTFPGAHDDQVDAFGDAFGFLARRQGLKLLVGKAPVDLD